ncbi:hypothetical protein NUH88_22085 [Nisaea acidiphila]|uniref:Uncharacterized protein n=1 Tax=Nisaea acidiphila TaxID=1862145 RepID=A0A9J7AS25_9PROT|nr:hypothetical protein [Nisaea acidiphila]UUX50063.1 hypothetical protein NUH88_22085 [Nisaea acidiphila]
MPDELSDPVLWLPVRSRTSVRIARNSPFLIEHRLPQGRAGQAVEDFVALQKRAEFLVESDRLFVPRIGGPVDLGNVRFIREAEQFAHKRGSDAGGARFPRYEKILDEKTSLTAGEGEDLRIGKEAAYRSHGLRDQDFQIALTLKKFGGHDMGHVGALIARRQTIESQEFLGEERKRIDIVWLRLANGYLTVS